MLRISIRKPQLLPLKCGRTRRQRLEMRFFALIHISLLGDLNWSAGDVPAGPMAREPGGRREGV